MLLADISSNHLATVLDWFSPEQIGSIHNRISKIGGKKNAEVLVGNLRSLGDDRL
jgi:hypothetical protein